MPGKSSKARERKLSGGASATSANGSGVASPGLLLDFIAKGRAIAVLGPGNLWGQKQPPDAGPKAGQSNTGPAGAACERADSQTRHSPSDWAAEHLKIIAATFRVVVAIGVGPQALEVLARGRTIIDDLHGPGEWNGWSPLLVSFSSRPWHGERAPRSARADRILEEVIGLFQNRLEVQSLSGREPSEAAGQQGGRSVAVLFLPHDTRDPIRSRLDSTLMPPGAMAARLPAGPGFVEVLRSRRLYRGAETGPNAAAVEVHVQLYCDRLRRLPPPTDALADAVTGPLGWDLYQLPALIHAHFEPGMPADPDVAHVFASTAHFHGPGPVTDLDLERPWVLLAGADGAGKTALLRYRARRAAEVCRRGGPIPVLVDFGGQDFLHRSDITRRILDSLAQESGLSGADVRGLLEQRGLTVFVDNLDRCRPSLERTWTWMADALEPLSPPGMTRVVATTGRVPAHGLQGSRDRWAPVYLLAGLGVSEQLDLAGAVLGPAREFRGTLAERPWALCRSHNPRLLRLLLATCSREGLPGTLGAWLQMLVRLAQDVLGPAVCDKAIEARAGVDGAARHDRHPGAIAWSGASHVLQDALTASWVRGRWLEDSTGTRSLLRSALLDARFRRCQVLPFLAALTESQDQMLELDEVLRSLPDTVEKDLLSLRAHCWAEAPRALPLQRRRVLIDCWTGAQRGHRSETGMTWISRVPDLDPSLEAWDLCGRIAPESHQYAHASRAACDLDVLEALLKQGDRTAWSARLALLARADWWEPKRVMAALSATRDGPPGPINSRHSAIFQGTVAGTSGELPGEPPDEVATFRLLGLLGHGTISERDRAVEILGRRGRPSGDHPLDFKGIQGEQAVLAEAVKGDLVPLLKLLGGYDGGRWRGPPATSGIDLLAAIVNARELPESLASAKEKSEDVLRKVRCAAVARLGHLALWRPDQIRPILARSLGDASLSRTAAAELARGGDLEGTRQCVRSALTGESDRSCWEALAAYPEREIGPLVEKVQGHAEAPWISPAAWWSISPLALDMPVLLPWLWRHTEEPIASTPGSEAIGRSGLRPTSVTEEDEETPTARDGPGVRRVSLSPSWSPLLPDSGDAVRSLSGEVEVAWKSQPSPSGTLQFQLDLTVAGQRIEIRSGPIVPVIELDRWSISTHASVLCDQIPSRGNGREVLLRCGHRIRFLLELLDQKDSNSSRKVDRDVTDEVIDRSLFLGVLGHLLLVVAPGDSPELPLAQIARRLSGQAPRSLAETSRTFLSLWYSLCTAESIVQVTSRNPRSISPEGWLSRVRRRLLGEPDRGSSGGEEQMATQVHVNELLEVIFGSWVLTGGGPQQDDQLVSEFALHEWVGKPLSERSELCFSKHPMGFLLALVSSVHDALRELGEAEVQMCGVQPLARSLLDDPSAPIARPLGALTIAAARRRSTKPTPDRALLEQRFRSLANALVNDGLAPLRLSFDIGEVGGARAAPPVEVMFEARAAPSKRAVDGGQPTLAEDRIRRALEHDDSQAAVSRAIVALEEGRMEDAEIARVARHLLPPLLEGAAAIPIEHASTMVPISRALAESDVRTFRDSIDRWLERKESGTSDRAAARTAGRTLGLLLAKMAPEKVRSVLEPLKRLEPDTVYTCGRIYLIQLLTCRTVSGSPDLLSLARRLLLRVAARGGLTRVDLEPYRQFKHAHGGRD